MHALLLALFVTTVPPQTSADPLARMRPYLAALSVADLDASVKWYESMLGFKTDKRMDLPKYGLKIAFLKSGAYRLEIIQKDASQSLKVLAPDIDDLETALLAAYRPPASIDRHPEFIAASGTLKEARELDALGLRHGALLRLLLAAQRIAPLRAPANPSSREELALKLRAAGDGLKDGSDDSIARLFVESGLAEIDAAPKDAPTPKALAALTHVLPLYRAALAPRSPVPVEPAFTTVTLVRWPYT